MSVTPKTLPLFPLNVVLFPTSRLPLHIFEERFKTMIRECREHGTLFGINLMDRNHLHPIGCSARIVEVTQHYHDGSFDIVVEGVERYKLVNFQETEAGYLLGNIERFADRREDIPEDVSLRAIALFNSLMDVVFPGGSKPQAFSSAKDRRNLSYIIAEKSGLDITERQRLLETPTESKRILELIRHLEVMIPRMREQQMIQKLISNDGYLPRRERRD